MFKLSGWGKQARSFGSSTVAYVSHRSPRAEHRRPMKRLLIANMQIQSTTTVLSPFPCFAHTEFAQPLDADDLFAAICFAHQGWLMNVKFKMCQQLLEVRGRMNIGNHPTVNPHAPAWHQSVMYGTLQSQSKSNTRKARLRVMATVMHKCSHAHEPCKLIHVSICGSDLYWQIVNKVKGTRSCDVFGKRRWCERTLEQHNSSIKWKYLTPHLLRLHPLQCLT